MEIDCEGRVYASLSNEYRHLHLKIMDLQREYNILTAEMGDRTSNFCSKIMEFVESLHSSTKYSDVLFRTPKALIPGHKFVLDARGGVWSSVVENGVEYIDIKDVCDALILWFYRGSINISEVHILCSLLILAKDFGLPTLLSQCEKVLIPMVNRENCVAIYDASFQSKANRLLQHCFTYLSTVWNQVPSDELRIFSALALRSFLEKFTRFPIHFAIRLDRDDTALSLLEAKPIESRTLVNQLDEDGLSPLYLSLQTGRLDLAEKFIDSGADPDLLIGPEQFKIPTSHYALEQNQYNVVKFLLFHGSQPNLCTEQSGQTILHRIAMYGPQKCQNKSLVELVSLLISRGAQINIRDRNGNTPLHLSIMHNSIEIFDLFMKHTQLLDLNTPNEAGLCPLWLGLIAQFGSSSVDNCKHYGLEYSKFTNDKLHNYASLLIQAGANTNQRFTNFVPCTQTQSTKLPLIGDTLLIGTVRIGLGSGALFLIKEGTDCDTSLESEAIEGETVLHVAVESRLGDVCQYLIMHCNVNPNRLRTVVEEKQTELTKVQLPDSNPPEPEKSSQSEKKSTNPFESDTSSDNENDYMSPSQIKTSTFDQSKSMLNGFSSNPFDDRLSNNDANGDFETRPPNLKNKRCQTALHLAVLNGQTQLIVLYLERKSKVPVDWFVFDDAGETVLSLTLWNNQLDLTDRILRTVVQDLKSDQSHPTIDEVLKKFTLPGKSSLLFGAIEHHQAEAVKFLVEQGVDVNERFIWQANTASVSCQSDTNDLVCPLWTALRSNQLDVANYLISHGACVDFWSLLHDTNIEVTLLHRAIFAQNETAGRYLISQDCDINALPRYANSTNATKATLPLDFLLSPQMARTPMHMAACLGMSGITQALVNSSNVDINKQDSNGQTPLLLAITNGHEKTAHILLQSDSVDCTTRNAEGFTAFHLAMKLKYLAIAQHLLKKDHNLALQVDNCGRNFLHIAVENIDREGIFFLIQVGVDMNVPVKSSACLTPIHLAIQSGVPEDILRSLLLAGCSISAQTPQKHSPLHLCVIHDRPELLHCLLENGADPNARDSESNTPLHLAIRHNKMSCFEHLLRHSDTNRCSINMRGQLPIHLLAQNHSPITIQMLTSLLSLNASEQINAQDAAGNTPLLLAYRASNIPLSIALLHSGASFGLVNNDGESVFGLSRKRSSSNLPDRVLAQLLDSLDREPKWEDGSTCVECGNKFGLTIRKHHCRHCGRLLCSNCSSFEMPLVKFSLAKPVRVCEVCFNFLNEPLGSL